MIKSSTQLHELNYNFRENRNKYRNLFHHKQQYQFPSPITNQNPKVNSITLEVAQSFPTIKICASPPEEETILEVFPTSASLMIEETIVEMFLTSNYMFATLHEV